jgi:glucose/arabinose dehydrogenase
MTRRLTTMLVSMLVLLGTWAGQASAVVQVKLQLLADGLVHPLVMLNPPDGSKRLFIVEQSGTVQILMPDGKLRPTPFIDLSKKMVKLDWEFDERGLLGMAFHPKFKDNGKFYVVYTAPVRTDAARRPRLLYCCTNYLSEFQVSKADPNKADLSTERIIYFWDKPQFNHNGGELLFGPDDGYLYISTGDGGWANDVAIGHTPKIGNAQDLKVNLGKILRIDVDSGTPYGIPKDNPFVGRSDALPEIWAYGLRNVWRMSFDAGGKHELFGADVGQNTWESVKIIQKGGNHGWNRIEGSHCFNPDDPSNANLPQTCDKTGLLMPIIEYGNMNVIKEGKGISITGGFVYRGKAMPSLVGSYIFGDWSKSFSEAQGLLLVAHPPKQSGAMWTIEDVQVVGMNFHSYVLALAQDENRELYVLVSDNTAPGRANDRIYKIVPAN